MAQCTRAQEGGGHLEVGVVKLEPLGSPGAASRLSWPVLGVLGLLLAKARAGGLHASQGVGTCIAKPPSWRLLKAGQV